MKAYNARSFWRMARGGVFPAALGVLFGALATPAGAASDTYTASAVRYGVSGAQHRLVLDMSDRPAFRVFTLEAPYRVVVDFPTTEWNIKEPVFGDAFPAAERMRFGLYKPGRSRLVLDLKQPMKVAAAFTVPARDGLPPRFVLDLEKTDAASYRLSAGWPSDARFRTAEADRGVPLPRPKPAHLGQPDTLLVMIDAGHGGIDPGAIRGGIQEKTIALAFAEELAHALDKSGRYRVAMTRTDDVFLSLRERVRLAEAAGADIFLSLHANTVESGDASGAAVHTLSDNASDQEAQDLAELENRADILAGVNLAGESDDVARILIDLSQRQTNHASDKLAKAMLTGLAPRIEVLKSRPHRSAGFRVLRSPTIPSLLLELGFMSDDEDLANMLNLTWRRRAAMGVVDALDQWREDMVERRMAQR
jgi:N-acetylmuramoyl-L-alanine amidase